MAVICAAGVRKEMVGLAEQPRVIRARTAPHPFTRLEVAVIQAENEVYHHACALQAEAA